MKKILAFLLAAVMLFAVAGCSQDGSDSKTPAGSQASGGAMPAVAKDDLKVGVIHIGEPADGAGYSYAHDQGIVAMQKELGLKDSQIIRKNNIPDTDTAKTQTAIEELVEEGCQVIFGTSFNYMNVMEQMAETYPKVIFSHCSGYKNNGKNMNNYFGRIYQARYLAGIAAGMKTQSNKIGYVAAMDVTNSEVTGGINAFAMGVKSVNADARVYVKVTNTWFDVTKEKQAAEALLADGCDVIAQHCDTPYPQTAAEKAGKWGIGYNSDMSKDAPKATLTSVVWDWGVYYTEAVKQVIDGTWKPENYYGGMKEGLVDISPLADFCKAGTKEAVEAARAKILDGSFNVFDGVIETNDGKTVGKEGGTLDDATITGGINWYFKNVVVK